MNVTGFVILSVFVIVFSLVGYLVVSVRYTEHKKEGGAGSKVKIENRSEK